MVEDHLAREHVMQILFIFNEYDASLKTMTIIVEEGWHTFAVDGTNLNIVSAVSNIIQRYVFLYKTKFSNENYAYCLEIYKYGFQELETDNVECTVYYLI